MKILIKEAEIMDPSSSHHHQKKNIYIENGKVTAITNELSEADLVIASENLKISPGWFDFRVNTCDPGFEHKEDIESVCNAAAFGGFTEILCTPNTKPVIQSKDVIGYIKGKARELLVEVHPSGAVTLERNGKELTDMMDMHYAGAAAFSDGDKPIWHTDILLKTLQYLQTFDGLLIQHAEEKQLTIGGQMNEGLESTLLGLKGIPKLAEELIIERDLNILKYTGGKIHFAHVSSPGSIHLIRKAKEEGYQVTCDIAAYQLVFDDTSLRTFDTNLKVNPPFRGAEDIDYFWKALSDGTIDVVTSEHIPQDEESKNLEFDLAEFGILGLETAFSLLTTYGEGRISLDRIIEVIAINPRKLLKLEVPVFKENVLANFTLFDPAMEWRFEKKDIRSKSKNTPFIGKELKGKALGVFNKGKFLMNKD